MPTLVFRLFLPAISLILCTLPALGAQTRLLLGRSLTYQVTEKRAPRPVGSTSRQ